MKIIAPILVLLSLLWIYLINPPIPPPFQSDVGIDWEGSNVIHVMYATDKFDCNIYGSIASVLKFTKVPVWFHIGTTETNSNAIPLLSKTSRISYYKIDQNNPVFHFKNLRKRLKNIAFAWARFILPPKLPTHVKTAFYLDTDTIVSTDLSNFVGEYNRYPFIMAEELGSTVKYALNQFGLKSPNFYSKYNYMYLKNSGVMLINVTKWISDNVTNRLIQYANDMEKRIGGAEDQLVLNIFSLDNNYGMLHPAFNMGCGGVYKIINPHPKRGGIIHICGPNKWTNYLNSIPEQYGILNILSETPSHKICNMRKLR